MVAGLAIPLPQARAAGQQLYWDPAQSSGASEGGTGLWDLSSAYWYNGSNDIAWTDSSGAGTDTATFAGTAGTVSLNANLSAAGLQFTTTGYTLNSNTGTFTLGIGAGGIDASSLTSGTTTFASDLNLTLLASQTWNVGTGATLSVAGPIAEANGSQSLTISGGGTVLFSGASTYTGVTTVTAGTLKLGSTSGPAISGNLVIQPDASTKPAVVQLLASNQLAPTATVTIGTHGGTANGNNQFDLNGFNQTIAGLIFTPQTSGQSVQVTTGTGILTLNGDISIQGTNSNPLSISGTGALDLNGRTLTIAESGNPTNPTLTISVPIQNGSINQTSPGAVVLAASNTFSGGATEAAGMLDLNNAHALGAGSLTITGGGIDNTTSSPLTLADHPEFWNASFTYGGTHSLNLGAGSVTLGTNVTITTTGNGSTLTVAGPISGSGFGLTVAGTSIVNLAGAIGYTGTTAVNNGRLTLSATSNLSAGTSLGGGTLNINSPTALGTGTLTVAGGTLDNTSAGPVTLSTNTPESWNGSFSFGGTQDLNLGAGAVTLGANVTVTTNATASLIVDGPIGGAFSLTKSGTGTLTLGGANSFTGATTVSQGTLNLDFSQGVTPADILAPASAVSLGQAILALTGNAGAFNSQTLGSFAVTNGQAALVVNQNGANSVNLALGAVSRSTGATLDIIPPSAGTITTSSPSVNGILGGWATVNGTDWASNTAGVVTAYSGYTADAWSAGTNTNVTANDTVPANSTTNSLRFSAGGNTVTLSGQNTIQSGGILVSSGAGAGDSIITGGTLASTSAADLIVIQNATTANLQINSVIADGLGATALTKSGNGSVILGGNNTFTGGLLLNAGVVRLANVGALNTQVPNAVTFGPATTGDLQLNGNSVTVSAINTNSSLGSPVVENASSTPAALTVNYTGGTTELYQGLLSDGTAGGSLSLVKIGTGTFGLANAETYTGSTTVNGGILRLDFSQSTAPTNNIINATSPLSLGSGTLYVVGRPNGTISQTFASTTLTGGATVTLAASTAATWSVALGNISRIPGGTVNFTNTSGAGENPTITTTTSNVDGILGGWAVASSVSWATSAGTGSTPGAITIYPGASYTNDAWAPDTNTTVTLASNTVADSTTNSIRFAQAAADTLTLTGTNYLQSGGILIGSTVGAHATSITGGNLTSGTSTGNESQELFVNQYDTSSSFTLASSIVDDGGGSTSLTKSGPGAMILSGTNTYTGTTTLNAGSTTFSSLSNLGASTAPLTFNGGALIWGSGNTSDISAGRTVTFGPAGATFSLGSNKVTLASPIGNSGSGSLTVITASNSVTLTLAGANAYGGGTNLGTSGGSIAEVAITSPTALGTGNVTVYNGAQLVINTTDPSTGSGLTAYLSGTGGSSNTGAIVGADNTSATWAGNVVILPGNSTTRLGGGNNGRLNVTGVISDGPGDSAINGLLVSRANGATTVFSGVNTYTVPTMMYQNSGTTGTLQLGVDNAISPSSLLTDYSASQPTPGPVVFDLNGHTENLKGINTYASDASKWTVTNSAPSTPATLTVSDPASDSYTYPGVIKDGASTLALIKTGAFTQTLSGNNTYSGGTAINGGTLLANNATTSTGTGPVAVNTGGTLAGTGKVTGPVAVNGIISAGTGATTASATGNLTTTGQQTWNTGGTYAWKLNLNNATAGSSTTLNSAPLYTNTTGANWDQLTMSLLTVAASSTSQFNVQVIGINGATGTGSAFDGSQAYQWIAATVPTIGLAGNYVGAFNLNVSNVPAATGQFTAQFVADPVTTSQDDLVISYAPAPEPGSLTLLALAAGAILMRRKRKAAAHA